MRLVATSLLLAIVLTSSAKPEASRGIEQAFDGAIKAINEERNKNRANQFGCTQFFSDFYRANKIEQYIVFFKSRGVQAVITNTNQQHFISFTIPFDQLRNWGYRNFYRGDTLVLVLRRHLVRTTSPLSLQRCLAAPIHECPLLALSRHLN